MIFHLTNNSLDSAVYNHHRTSPAILIRLRNSYASPFKFKYSFKPSNSVISEVREDFRRDVNNIFDEVVIISEEDMMRVNDLIGGGYPHRNFG